MKIHQKSIKIAIESLNDAIDLLNDLDSQFIGENTKEVAEGADRYEISHHNADNRSIYTARQWEAVNKASNRQLSEAEERAEDYSDGEELFRGCESLDACIGKIAYFLFFIEEEKKIDEEIKETIKNLENYETKLDELSEEYDRIEALLDIGEKATESNDEEDQEEAYNKLLNFLENTAEIKLNKLKEELSEALDNLRN